MLDKEGKGIDAVSVSTPDHMHAAAAMAAIERKKHVYVQNRSPTISMKHDARRSG